MLEADALRVSSPVPGKTQLSLPKESLIRKGSEYAFCYAEGRRLHTRHFLLFVASGAPGSNGLRMGTAVSRKVGHAVVRNRIKRLLRECFRQHLRSLPVSARVVVVAKKQAGVSHLVLSDVVREVGQALEKYFRPGGGA